MTKLAAPPLPVNDPPDGVDPDISSEVAGYVTTLLRDNTGDWRDIGRMLVHFGQIAEAAAVVDGDDLLRRFHAASDEPEGEPDPVKVVRIARTLVASAVITIESLVDSDSPLYGKIDAADVAARLTHFLVQVAGDDWRDQIRPEMALRSAGCLR